MKVTYPLFLLSLFSLVMLLLVGCTSQGPLSERQKEGLDDLRHTAIHTVPRHY